jgi:hypothetical protein
MSRFWITTFRLAILVGGMAAWPVAAHGQLISGAAHRWDASADVDGNSIWEDTGTLGNLDWTLSGPSGSSAGPQRVAVTTSTAITHAYDFDGVDDAGAAATENRGDNHDTTFELWFRPSTLVAGSARPIFEHGNAPRGITIGLSDDLLVLAYAASPDSASLSFDLDADDNGIDNLGFIQVVGVVDDTNDQLRLYVDGGNEQMVSLGGGTNDFTSNDELGLAFNQGRGGGGQDGSTLVWDGVFAGQIGVLREYRSAFGVAEVSQNYVAMTVPEPSAGAVLVLGAVWPLVAWRRRQRRART